ncbi:MAG: uroporphyrinogen decarboxylase, partial [bacterium]|nr:uroporphyrinogen decarboxylase [bacterium]
ALQRYGYDAVFAIFDTCVEAEAVGCKIRYQENLYPAVESFVLTPDTNVAELKVPDPYSAGRMPELLKTIAILRREVGNETVVVGCVLGPMTLATQFIGIEEALYMAADTPDKFAQVLDYATEMAITFAQAQLEAGAHLPVLVDLSASPDVIPPSYYREFILPRHKKIFEAFLSAGTAANWLYIPGSTLPILPYYKECGVHVANIDYTVDMARAIESLPGVCLDGNIKPLAFVDSNPDEIIA